MNDPTTQDLNLLDEAQIGAWLREALHGRLGTPLTRDEPAHERVLRTERRLERAARAAIRRASEALARELPAASAPDLDYVESLLHLLDALRRPVAPMLMQMARDWPAWIRGHEELQRVLLATIVDLQEADSRAFWLEIVGNHGATFSATAFAGILLHAPEAALAALPTWPVNALASRAIGVLLGQKLGAMAPGQRRELIVAARDVLDGCAAPLRGALERALARYPEPSMASGRARPPASFRAALRSRFPESGRSLGTVQSPRLVPVAA